MSFAFFIAGPAGEATWENVTLEVFFSSYEIVNGQIRENYLRKGVPTMKPKMDLIKSLCLVMTALLLCGSTPFQPSNLPQSEPIVGHSVEEALNHALAYTESKYDLHGLTQLAWIANTDNHPDMLNATHHVFISKAETLSELQAAYAINPAHAGFTSGQLTVYVHAPDNQLFHHMITILDTETHRQWVGTIDIDGHIYEYKGFE